MSRSLARGAEILIHSAHNAGFGAMETKTAVYIETFGCQMNVADTERAFTRLRAAGYDIVSAEENADVVLFNTCSVRERAEQKALTRIGEVRRANRNKPLKVGVMGCVAQLEGASLFSRGNVLDLVVGTRATDRLPELIERAKGGETRILDLDERGENDSWEVSSFERHSPYVAFVPIIEGCNKFCSFCIVPYSRGREKSRPASEIIQEVNELRSLGYREVHLIGQNVNSYRPRTESGLEGVRGATTFSRLLRAVAQTGFERIRFTTSFPRDFHPDIVAALDEHENLCDWVHLPVQSGSDRILRLMRRGHTSADYLARVAAVKNARRRLALTSDIIVGFPGETRADFDATLRLIERCSYDALFIFKYSRRSGTPSASFEDTVSQEEKTARFLELETLQRSIQEKTWANYVGRTVEVLVEGESARGNDDMRGHSSCNKIVNFRGGNDLLGRLVNVRITSAKANSLYGEIEAYPRAIR